MSTATIDPPSIPSAPVVATYAYASDPTTVHVDDPLARSELEAEIDGRDSSAGSRIAVGQSSPPLGAGFRVETDERPLLDVGHDEVLADELGRRAGSPVRPREIAGGQFEGVETHAWGALQERPDAQDRRHSRPRQTGQGGAGQAWRRRRPRDDGDEGEGEADEGEWSAQQRVEATITDRRLVDQQQRHERRRHESGEAQHEHPPMVHARDEQHVSPSEHEVMRVDALENHHAAGLASMVDGLDAAQG